MLSTRELGIARQYPLRRLACLNIQHLVTHRIRKAEHGNTALSLPKEVSHAIREGLAASAAHSQIGARDFESVLSIYEYAKASF